MTGHPSSSFPSFLSCFLTSSTEEARPLPLPEIDKKNKKGNDQKDRLGLRLILNIFVWTFILIKLQQNWQVADEVK